MTKLGRRAGSAQIRYLRDGLILGACFPIVATMADTLTRNLTVSLASILTVQREQPLHWVVDTFPLVFAFFGWLMGRRLDRADRFSAELEAKVAERTEELSQANRQLVDEVEERQRTQEALRESEQRILTILNSVIDAIITIDETGKIVSVNPAVEPIFGYAPDEVIGQNVTVLMPEPDRSRHGSYIERFLETGETRVIGIGREVSAKRKDGTVFPIDLGVSAVDLGEQKMFVGVIRDITDRRRSEEELLRARGEADAANRAKGDFLARMSHEIRTPMNAIIGMTHLALQTELTAKQHDYLSKAQSAARALLGIINDILDFSKIEAGKMTMESIDFNLDAVMDSLANLVAGAAEDKGLEVLLATDRGVPFNLVGDPLRLGQVLTNLTSNAIKFTSEGEVVVTTEVVDQGDDNVTLRFSVSDTGIGLTEEQAGNLFQAFSQAEGATTRKYGGTGLGLAICRRLVEMMEGEIGVTSKAGKGSTFAFTARFGVRHEKDEDAYQPSVDLRGMRVLVVDDNETARDILSAALTSFSFDVRAVESGEAALEELKSTAEAPGSEPYKLVVMDWRMPGLDGIETSVRIKRDLGLPDTPSIILVTAYGREEVVKQAEQAGLDGFLTKPVGHSALFDTVMEAFGKQAVKEVRPSGQRDWDAERLGQIAGARILLVEDNAINQQVATELLERAGLAVTVADNGLEAVRITSELGPDDEFDAVLMDIQMPEMDRYEATGEIRKNPRFKRVPIIAMTAHALAEERERCLEAGMNDHVAKPVDPDELFPTLCRWIKPGERTISTVRARTERAQTEEDIVFPEMPGIDVAAGLSRVAGNDRLYKQLLTHFHRDNQNIVRSIQDALDRSEFEVAQRFAHTLKGVAGNIGAGSVFEAAGALEGTIKNKETDDLVSLLGALDSALLQALSSTAVFESEGPGDEDEAGEEVPVDVAAVEPLLVDLAALLETDFMEAANRLEALKEHLARSCVAAEFKRLAGHMESFDTDAAKESLASLAQGLNVSL